MRVHHPSMDVWLCGQVPGTGLQWGSCVCDRKMRILAAGGDGTVAWILKTIRDLELDPPPYVAVMPLGTGNDLSLSFGWGNTFLQSWIDVSTAPSLL